MGFQRRFRSDRVSCPATLQLQLSLHLPTGHMKQRRKKGCHSHSVFSCLPEEAGRTVYKDSVAILQISFYCVHHSIELYTMKEPAIFAWDIAVSCYHHLCCIIEQTLSLSQIVSIKKSLRSKFGNCGQDMVLRQVCIESI